MRCMAQVKCFVLGELCLSEQLSSYISSTQGLDLVLSSPSLFELIGEIQEAKLSPLLVFVDIDYFTNYKMVWDLNGKIDWVVFLSSSEERAFSAFEQGVSDFLLKPLTYSRFLRTVNKIINSFMEPRFRDILNDCIYVNVSRGRYEKVRFDEIYYIEASQNYVNLHLNHKSVVCHWTLKDIEKRLPRENFIRVHKSFIVNERKIEGIKNDHVILLDDRSVKIGERFRNSFYLKLML